MMRKFLKGFRLGSNADALANEGEVKYNDTTKEIQYKDDAGTKTIINSDSFTGAGVSVGTDGNGKAQVTIAGGGGGGSYPEIVVLKDVKNNNTHGGTNVAGWQQRVLNTQEGSETWLTNFSSNQFDLDAGTYYITGATPAYAVGPHKCKLRNVSDSTDDIIGGNAQSITGAGTDSILMGIITIASTKTFEVQHFTTSVNTTDGLGVKCTTSAIDVSSDEVYTKLTITKIG